MIVIVMGVAGSGKTTVGKRLADALGWRFFDADDFHSAANIEKMRHGVALTDADRAEWLSALRRQIEEQIDNKTSAVFACSALKEIHRQQLRGDSNTVRFVYLKADYEFISKRLEKREGHYFGTKLLASQFETLEEPTDAVVVNARLAPHDAVAAIRTALAI
jgi:gluconokinase